MFLLSWSCVSIISNFRALHYTYLILHSTTNHWRRSRCIPFRLQSTQWHHLRCAGDYELMFFERRMIKLDGSMYCYCGSSGRVTQEKVLLLTIKDLICQGHSFRFLIESSFQGRNVTKKTFSIWEQYIIFVVTLILPKDH